MKVYDVLRRKIGKVGWGVGISGKELLDFKSETCISGEFRVNCADIN
jgi:hypothetical protein